MSATTQPVAPPRADDAEKPVLVFFTSQKSGHCRRAEGFLAQVLQRRRNHETFTIHRIDHDSCPDLARKVGIEQPPAILVLEGSKVRARVDNLNGCAELRKTLAPWLK